MWFRNLQLFRIPSPFGLSPEELHGRLAHHAFRPCGSLELATRGWVPPLGRDGAMLVQAADGRLLMCMRRQERVLPAAAVTEALQERLAALEAERGRPLGRKERQALREDVVQTLLPRALLRSRHTWAYIDGREGWLVVDAGARGQAEALAGLLRDSLGGLKALPPAVRSAPAGVMTGWLTERALPPDLTLGDACELRDPGEDGAVVRCRRQALDADEVRGHLEAGKLVVALALEWEDRLTCLVGQDLSVRRLRFADELLREAAANGDDEAARLDADLALMGAELGRFIPRLLILFGGEDQDAYGAQGAVR
jgi:recombination associated protein RdgC